jgi:hypothetical protein
VHPASRCRLSRKVCDAFVQPCGFAPLSRCRLSRPSRGADSPLLRKPTSFARPFALSLSEASLTLSSASYDVLADLQAACFKETARPQKVFFAGAPLNLLFSALKSAPVLSSRCMGEGYLLTPSPSMMLAGPRANDLQQTPPAFCCMFAVAALLVGILVVIILWRQVRDTAQQQQSEMTVVMVNEQQPINNIDDDRCPAPPRLRPPPRKEVADHLWPYLSGDPCPTPQRLRPPVAYTNGGNDLSLR